MKVQVENLHYLLEMRTERKGKLQQAVCYRDGGETKQLDLEGRRGEAEQLCYLFPCPKVTYGFPGSACWNLGLRQNHEYGEGGCKGRSV